MNSAAISRTSRESLFIKLLLVATLLTSAYQTTSIYAQPGEPPAANWIWSARGQDSDTAAGICYFRKTFVLQEKSQGRIELACDQDYTLYVNGIKIASGSGYAQLKRHSIGPYLQSGRNVVAIEGLKNDSGPAGLIATITLAGSNNKEFQMVTNETWKTSLEETGGWQQSEFRDSSWLAAQIIATGDDTQIWKKPAGLPSANDQASPRSSRNRANNEAGLSRFRVTREFRVEWVVRSEDAGSLIAMTFDEFGNIIASREEGPLLLIRDMDRDGVTETVTTYCEQVKNCQGILAMNGQVMVTGDGPQGCGLYRLSDDDRNGIIDHIHLVLPFNGKMQEHGPHALRLGPDGMVYLLAGNLSQIDAEFHTGSPYKNFYEGDLVQPRYEDPRGHANSGKAPGGTILRIDPSGNRIERFAGGLRNPYDIAFNASGDLFTWDADMEWDQGTSWYRPTRGNHIIPGAEFGWRSGWAKWPDYFLDSLPAFSETGNGSPTGITVYNHFMFPSRYQGSLFVGDWAQGRILEVRLKRQGASYGGEVRVFLEGHPLNVTDMEVGPDGMIYFCTGGRGTDGGVYRIAWTGQVPPQVQDLGTGIETAIRQPQLQTAWARQRIALVKQELGKQWNDQLLAITIDPAASIPRRTRAIDLLQLYGPQPTVELLIQLSKDRAGRIRTKSVYFLGLHSNQEAVQRLVELLDDPNVVVKRTVCESLARSGSTNVPEEKLVALLGHGDRYLAWAASKTLQNLPLENWQDLVIQAEDQRTFLLGSAAILATKPDHDTCLEILNSAHVLMKGFVADREFIDLLRVMQIALHQSKIKSETVPNLMQQISSEFPSGNATINRELIRLLAYLESPLVATRYMNYLKRDISLPDKTHLIVHAPYLIKGWTPAEQFQILQLIAKTQAEANSESHARYLDDAARRFVSRMDPSQQLLVLDRGAEWPGAALGAIAKLPKQPDTATLTKLKNLDRKLAQIEGEAASRLRIGIAAVIARSGDEQEMAYLRELFENEPERRSILAVALAQHPEDANWPLLLRSLSVLEDGFAVEVLGKLLAAKQTSEDPQVIRQVILLGLRQNQDAGRRRATALLAKWAGETPAGTADSESDKLTAWQAWFRKTYPDLPDPVLPQEAEGDRYSYAELEQYLESDDALAANPKLGRNIYAKAQCVKCHRFGELGSGVGPDLTTVSKRFQKKELLESIIFPSHIIPDQYATKTVATASGRILRGIVHQNNDGSVVVVDPEGKQASVAAEDIDEIVPNKESTMPPGLLNALSLEEIASLFAFLNQQPPAAVSRRVDR